MMTGVQPQCLNEERNHVVRIHVGLQDEQEFANNVKLGEPLLQVEPLERARL